MMSRCFREHSQEEQIRLQRLRYCRAAAFILAACGWLTLVIWIAVFISAKRYADNTPELPGIDNFAKLAPLAFFIFYWWVAGLAVLIGLLCTLLAVVSHQAIKE